MAHAQCMLNTRGYRHKIIAFPHAITVARMRLDVMLYVHCLTC
jgi:hypothetical protein